MDSGQKKELLKAYSDFRGIIKERLGEFKCNWSNEETVFKELVFCILTPQSKAVQCNECVKEIFKVRPMDWDKEFLESVFRPKTRFFRKKAEKVLLARDSFGITGLKKALVENQVEENVFTARKWLVKNVKGFGLKEASHFLRNIGFFENIAIIDRHILKNLVFYGVIKELPKNVGEKEYLELEEKMRCFASEIKIPIEELDLLFWAKETGFVFK